MLPIISGQFDHGLPLKCKTLLASLVLTSLIFTGCSNITLKPKDPELIALANFAKNVTTHLFEVNPTSYSEFKKSLEKEIAPNVLSQLKKQGFCPTSKEQIKKNVQTMDKNGQRCLIRVESTTFPAKVTAQGLVPIEVQGICIRSVHDLSKASKFDVLYLIGTQLGAKGFHPMVASIEIKKLVR